tara:strand:+ start:527 stop:784 length:258 start_codon:yes stop_codon:yes gene_type:complete
MNEGGCTVRVFKNKGTRARSFFDLPEFPSAIHMVGGGVDTGEWVKGMVKRGFELHFRKRFRNHSVWTYDPSRPENGGYILARKPK